MWRKTRDKHAKDTKTREKHSHAVGAKDCAVDIRESPRYSLWLIAATKLWRWTSFLEDTDGNPSQFVGERILG